MRTFHYQPWLVAVMSALLSRGAEGGTLFSSVVRDDTNENRVNIVGGAPVVNESKYPYYAMTSSGTLCGATLVHDDILVSAAHCAGAFRNKTIYIGATLLDGSNAKDKIRASYETVHPDFEEEALLNDVLLIKLSRRSTIAPLPYAASETLPLTGATTTVIGFGSTKFKGDLSYELEEVRVDVRDHVTCEASYGALDRTVQLCAGGDGKDSCNGDSGGPMISSSGILVGIVSFGYQCGEEGYPGVYTRVGGVASFIQKGICNMSDYPPASCKPDVDQCPRCRGLFSAKGLRMHLPASNGQRCQSSCIALFPDLLAALGWECGSCP
jgi:trypsin